MGRKISKYVEVFKVGLLSRLAYVYDVIFRQLFLVIVMYVFAQLGQTTYAWEGTADLSGVTMKQMIWYLALAESMVMGMPAVGKTIDEEVKSGSLAYSLSRPYNYGLFHYAGYMAEVSFRFLLNLLIAGSVAWAIVGPPVFSAGTFLAGLLCVIIGFTIDFGVQFGIGLGAFWVEDTWAFRFLYTRIVMIFGGMMLPLDILPDAVRQVARALPTSLIVYGPVRTFISFSPGEWAILVGKQVVWLTAVVFVVKLVFKTGVKQVNVHGG